MKSGCRSRFIARYGSVYERSPWVAVCAAKHLAGTQDVDAVARAMAACVDKAPLERQLALIREHPDLAHKAAVAGELTTASAAEQASAGLDRCPPVEFARFAELNRSYRDKFDFPFVMAVRDSGRAEILNAFENRLENDRATELRTALAEIHKIARLRLQTLDDAE